MAPPRFASPVLPPRTGAALTALLAALALSAPLPARASASASLAPRAALPAATYAAVAPPAQAVTLPAWWLGFADPALDQLMRAALQGPASASLPPAAVSAHVGTLYVTARWLSAKRVLALKLQEVRAQQRHWVALEGPTPHAAQALAQIDHSAADMARQAADMATRAEAIGAELRSLSPLPGTDMDALLGALMAHKTVPRFDLLPHDVAGARARSLEPQAARVQQLEQAGMAMGARFEAARKALESGSISEREVLQVYERLLLETDQVLQAQAELAVGWVQVLAHGEAE